MDIILENQAKSNEKINWYLTAWFGLPDVIERKIFKHVEKHGLKPHVVEFHEDVRSMYSEWCNPKRETPFTKEHARKIYNDGLRTGEFQRITGFGVFRYAP